MRVGVAAAVHMAFQWGVEYAEQAVQFAVQQQAQHRVVQPQPLGLGHAAQAGAHQHFAIRRAVADLATDEFHAQGKRPLALRMPGAAGAQPKRHVFAVIDAVHVDHRRVAHLTQPRGGLGKAGGQ